MSGKVRRPARVERRGRFTITEIDPESPSALPGAMSAFSDTDGDQDAAGSEDRPSFTHESAAAAVFVASSDRLAMGAGEPSPVAMIERQNIFAGSESAGSVVLASGEVAAEAETAHSDSSSVLMPQDQAQQSVGASSPQPNGVAEASVEAAVTQPDRRVKRKGRFTIIELSSRDSPRSRRNSDELERFSTTTSISTTASHSHSQTFGSRTSNHEASSSSNGSVRSSRMHAAAEAFERGRAERPARQTPRMRSVSPVGAARDRAASYQRPTMGGSYGSLPFRHASPKSRPGDVEAFGSSSSQHGLSSSDRRPTAPELGASRRHLASRQKAITISADQFLQQQQTIASLIRQQHDLKQLIGVLQEQQQYLVSIPMQLNELKLEQAQTNAQEETMREMHMQIEALTRANEGLQSLLSQAEHDANERTMEIEYLLEENHQLRQRCGHFERKYGEERQISFALEQELQQIHMSRQRRKSEPAQRQVVTPGATGVQNQPASESSAAAEN
ncbi:hypothetical protein PINS_up011863 [Pythium insidiosum]|nr:hypothetical protein PINS_up011863 [Pythium insidiosum]